MLFGRARIWAARLAAAVVLLVIVTALSTLAAHTASTPRTGGASHPLSRTEISPFDPGDIISDDTFYDSEAMTETGIQQWLLAMPCTPKDLSPCLAFFRQDTQTRAANADCLGYRGAKDETAAAIVAKVARACGINPRVLLVLVQKEQSLVTRPSAYGYERATGYACPDTAECDRKYFGFFNQLYSAAWQFREYSNPADDWRIAPGRVRLQFSPDAACGASLVDIANQATANLYLYTPYQPDQYTRENPGAPAQHCSSYGNLNFYQLFNSWFGDSRADRYPEWWGPCLSHPGGLACLQRH